MQRIFQTGHGLVMKIIHANECVFASLPGWQKEMIKCYL